LTDYSLRSGEAARRVIQDVRWWGLFVLVKPNGSMLWRYKSSLGEGEALTWANIQPSSSPTPARRHQDAKIKLQVGVDPSAARQAERAERQVAEAEAALGRRPLEALPIMAQDPRPGKGKRVWRKRKSRNGSKPMPVK